MLNAQMPERTPRILQNTKNMCRAHIYKDMKGMYRETGGALVFPFLAPEVINTWICYGIGILG